MSKLAGAERSSASGPDFVDWAKQSDIFSALAAAKFYKPTLRSGGGMERLDGFQVTPDIFKLLEVQPAMDRLFAAGDDQPGRDHVVVLGKGFGARLSVLGVAIGLLIALALGRILAFFLRGVTLGEVSTYLGVSLLLLVVTLLANYFPARRATRIDPMAALRYE